MFRRLPEDARATVTIVVDGDAVEARAGDSVAAALLASGQLAFRRSPVGSGPRGPLCMMGGCFECLVAIDGIGSRQACMVRVRDGMRIELGGGARDLGVDRE